MATKSVINVEEMGKKEYKFVYTKILTSQDSRDIESELLRFTEFSSIVIDIILSFCTSAAAYILSCSRPPYTDEDSDVDSYIETVGIIDTLIFCLGRHSPCKIGSIEYGHKLIGHWKRIEYPDNKHLESARTTAALMLNLISDHDQNNNAVYFIPEALVIDQLVACMSDRITDDEIETIKKGIEREITNVPDPSDDYKLLLHKCKKRKGEDMRIYFKKQKT
jgi:hypothetical protein